MTVKKATRARRGGEKGMLPLSKNVQRQGALFSPESDEEVTCDYQISGSSLRAV